MAAFDKWVVVPESVLTALPALYSNALVFARPISYIFWRLVAKTVPLVGCAVSTNLKVLKFSISPETKLISGEP